jgi:Ca2+/H+ antiporter
MIGMHNRTFFGTPIWSIALPIVGCVTLAAVWGRPLGWTLLTFDVIALAAAVFAAVHHAEVIALRVGEPFGTLVLALAVTVIEASLIVALSLISLVAVIGLAKSLSPSIATAVESASVPHAVVGIAIALMVLLPETVAAARAALRNRMQTSFNLALGSALATIGLTIPAVAVTSLALGLALDLGLPMKEIALLALTLLISAMTLSRGRATVLQGAVHLVLFAVFLFLAIVP